MRCNSIWKSLILMSLGLMIILPSGTIYAQIIFNAPALIGRVTDQSVTINIETNLGIQYYFEYGFESGSYLDRLPQTGYNISTANEPFEVTIEGLNSNARYYYRQVYRLDSGSDWIIGDEYTFHTKRALESDFVFTITSDSHQSTATLDNPRNLYHQTLSNVQGDNPDLHFDLGDTFAMTNIEIGDTTQTRAEYLSQRSSMARISHSTPVYLIIGNHEEEEGWNLDDAGADIALSKPIMSINARKKFFLNPIPDGFYSGNPDVIQVEIDDDHLRENYFSFEWGDALFVGIDPYANTQLKPYAGTAGGEENDEVVGDRWDWTLGEDQYHWLKERLESSSAKWKFVFSHQVVGGTSDYGRGGAEATTNYEWGASTDNFSSQRPGWVSNTSIHQLMLENGVAIFFHGHDHVYAMEEIDGMIYQECPQPSDIHYTSGFGNYQNSESTVVVNNSGHIRVSVSPVAVTVDYIRAFLPGAGSNGTIGHSYTISSPITTEPPAPQSINNFELYQNYPNPFNPSTTIRFSLPETSDVNIIIFDIQGRRVISWTDRGLQAGRHSIQWQGIDQTGSAIVSGTYFAKVQAGLNTNTIKMLYLR